MSTMNSTSTEIKEDESIVVCPSCRDYIPFFKVVSEEGNHFLQIQCVCSQELINIKLEKYNQSIKEYNKSEEGKKCFRKNHANQKAQKYCTICRDWMCEDCFDLHNEIAKGHILRNRVLKLSCEDHKQPLNRHCEECNKTICEQCVESHSKTHHIIQGNDISLDSFDNDIEKMQSIMNANEKYKIEFDSYIKAIVDELTKWKTEVDQAYSISKQMHLQLKKYCELVKKTTQIININSNYPLCHSVVSLTVTTKTELQNMRTQLEGKYKTLHKQSTEKITLTIKKLLKMKTNFSSENSVQQDHQPTYQHKKKTDIPEDLFSLIQLEDGRLVSGGNDGMIKLFDKMSLECLDSFKAHSNWVTSLHQLHDGRLISGGNDSQIIVWNIFTFKKITSFQGHSNWVTSFTQLSDGRLVSGGNDNMIKFWNMTNFECVDSFKAGSYEVTSLLELDDGRLVSGGIDNMIKFWDVTTHLCLYSIKAHTSCVTSLVQLKNKSLVSGGNDATIKIWDLETNKCKKEITTGLPCVTSLFQMDNALLVSLSSCNYVFFDFGEVPFSSIEQYDM